MKGITSGYLNNSPFEALTLAMIIQIIFKSYKKYNYWYSDNNET